MLMPASCAPGLAQPRRRSRRAARRRCRRHGRCPGSSARRDGYGRDSRRRRADRRQLVEIEQQREDAVAQPVPARSAAAHASPRRGRGRTDRSFGRPRVRACSAIAPGFVARRSTGGAHRVRLRQRQGPPAGRPHGSRNRNRRRRTRCCVWPCSRQSCFCAASAGWSNSGWV